MPTRIIKTAISDVRLDMRTKVATNGAVYLFIKDSGGAYHAFTEGQLKLSLRNCGCKNTKGVNSRKAAKDFLGF